MVDAPKSDGDDKRRDTETERLRQRLMEAEETIEALLAKEVDAVVDVQAASPLLLRDAQDALRASEETFRAVFEGAMDAMLVADDEGRYLQVNPAACKLFGVAEESLLGRTAADFSPADYDFVATWQEFQASERMFGEFPLVRPDGETRITEYNAVTNFLPGRHLSILRDVTERKRLEQALRASEAHRIRQERLAAVGQLTTGLAHAFNNILTGLMLRTETILQSPTLSDDVRASLEAVGDQGAEAATLIQKLLAFSRRSLLRTAPVDLVALVRQQAETMREQLPPGVELVLSLPEEDSNAFTVKGDARQLSDVLENLVLNGQDALPGGGELTIKLSRAMMNSKCAVCRADVTGEWVALTVRDNGTGISAEIEDQIFEPFFTTRVPERRGLGLSQVLGIVKQHGGHIAVESKPGLGTAITVYLPPLA